MAEPATPLMKSRRRIVPPKVQNHADDVCDYSRDRMVGEWRRSTCCAAEDFNGGGLLRGQRGKLRPFTATSAFRPKPDSALAFMSARPHYPLGRDFGCDVMRGKTAQVAAAVPTVSIKSKSRLRIHSANAGAIAKLANQIIVLQGSGFVLAPQSFRWDGQ
jgi:hypothetical protein